ncbi:MAG: L,D-transpeptidase [Candidatus Peregrinibacteria bacterium]
MKYHTLITGLLVLTFGLFANCGTGSAEAGVIENMIKWSVQAEVKVSSGWVNVSYTEFFPSSGDYFVVNVTDGRGYLMNGITRFYTDFPVMTGTPGHSTPCKDWVVLEKNIQSNRIVFSKSGEFFRLFADGTKRTSYGIHGYAYFDKEIENGRKFLSLGCIMVADDVLDIIEESYIANGNSLKVSTRETMDPTVF